VSAVEIFETALESVRRDYARLVFYVERDVVWTLQSRMREAMQARDLGLRLFNDYPILPGRRRGLSADLVILRGEEILLAVEVKYEPSHARTDIPQGKLPVVFWGAEGVAKDIERIQQFVASGRVRHAISVFLDEGGAFRQRPPHPRSTWIDWSVVGPDWLRPALLWCEAVER
jgi:hypothetical protein